MSELQPSASAADREFTLRAVVAGVLFGALFGAANAYIGLRVGMTVATSIPVAIMTVAAARALRADVGLRETNLAQTIGSASTSLATGAIFTLPALYLWGRPPSYWQIAALALCGGVLGVAAMVPLRRMLIVDQADELPYPEGTACAMVLRSARAESSVARWIAWGLVIGLVVRVALGFRLLPGEVGFELPLLPRGEIGLEITPALLGVGVILGIRPASVLVSGSALAALVITPVIAVWGADLGLAMLDGRSIESLGAGDIWKNFVRYLGAGAVAAAGVLSVVRGLPTMIHAVSSVAARARRGGLGDSGGPRELSGRTVGGLVLAVALAAMFVPGLLAPDLPPVQRLVAGLMVSVFGVLFVAVMARIAGIVGTSSQPTSGITIATLLAVGVVFAVLGWSDITSKMALLSVGAIVAIAASSSGDTAQDLKTGHLVGATPLAQQAGQLIGMATACWAVAATLVFLGATAEFGSKEIPAPQATLITAIIDGLLDGSLPWKLFYAGAALAIVAVFVRLDALAFAIGLYLPLPAMLPIFVGGVLRWYVDRSTDTSSGLRPGVLAASGLVAGEGLAGVAVAGALGTGAATRPDVPIIGGAGGAVAALALAASLAWFLVRSERR